MGDKAVAKVPCIELMCFLSTLSAAGRTTCEGRRSLIRRNASLKLMIYYENGYFAAMSVAYR